ncbi:MAG: hypothetical protein K6D37_00410 [Prevotella sp.]|nr:hypothetical protein [Prevotella sp.]
MQKNQQLYLSEHFSLGEMTRTRFQTKDGNAPSLESINNLKRLCEDWLEELRYTYNALYCLQPGEDYETSASVEPLVISQGYRSEEVMEQMIRAGYHPSPTSNHLKGCAVDIRCAGIEQALRYAVILIDLADDTRRDFDELFVERNRRGIYWIHLAVRAAGNRRKVGILEG